MACFRRWCGREDASRRVPKAGRLKGEGLVGVRLVVTAELMREATPATVCRPKQMELWRRFAALTLEEVWRFPLLVHGATSRADGAALAEGHEHGFVCAATTAFGEHAPLGVSPSHFWLLVLQGVAMHARLRPQTARLKLAREARYAAVEVEGADVVMPNRLSPGKEAPSNDWESVVDGFLAQLREHSREGVLEALTPPFSTATRDERVAARAARGDLDFAVSVTFEERLASVPTARAWAAPGRGRRHSRGRLPVVLFPQGADRVRLPLRAIGRDTRRLGPPPRPGRFARRRTLRRRLRAAMARLPEPAPRSPPARVRRGPQGQTGRRDLLEFHDQTGRHPRLRLPNLVQRVDQHLLPVHPKGL